MLRRFLVVLPLFVVIAFADGQPISDENLRVAVLHAVFPGMKISIVPGLKIDNSGPGEPDALAGEKVYQVVGKPANDAEAGAAENVAPCTCPIRATPNLSFFPGRKRIRALSRFYSYDFPGANPALCCLSIGLLAHLNREGGVWKLRDEYLLETQHHSNLSAARFIGTNMLMLESDFGGGAASALILRVFDLSHGRFDEILNQYSSLQNFAGDDDQQQIYKQKLDEQRVLQTNGNEFCFVKTAQIENGKRFNPPRVTHPCYKRGDGVDAKESAERNKLLKPLPRSAQ